MKNNKIIFTVISAFIILTMVGSWTMTGLMQIKTKPNNLSFEGRSNKDAYIVGEPITVEFEFTNLGENPINIGAEGVEVGSLKIFIASGHDGEYKEYFGSGWGRKRGQVIALGPNQSHKYKGATILWNGKPRVSHLNETAANRLLQGKITTEYALPDTGVYFIKGRSYAGGDASPIEAEPIKIVVNEPVGDDFEVWNKIKGDREIAFLMQKGAFDTGEEERKQQLMAKVEQILIHHPNSIYSSYLRENLEKYKVSEAKRNKAFKNIRSGQKP